MSVNQAHCRATLLQCVPENTDADYGIKRILNPYFFKLGLNKLAPGESKNQDRAKVGQS